MTRVRLSFMVSGALNETLEEIYEEESKKATKDGVSPPAMSRVFEKLLALGVRQHRQQEMKE